MILKTFRRETKHNHHVTKIPGTESNAADITEALKYTGVLRQEFNNNFFKQRNPNPITNKLQRELSSIDKHNINETIKTIKKSGEWNNLSKSTKKIGDVPLIPFQSYPIKITGMNASIKVQGRRFNFEINDSFLDGTYQGILTEADGDLCLIIKMDKSSIKLNKSDKVKERKITVKSINDVIIKKAEKKRCSDALVRLDEIAKKLSIKEDNHKVNTAKDACALLKEDENILVQESKLLKEYEDTVKEDLKQKGRINTFTKSTIRTKAKEVNALQDALYRIVNNIFVEKNKLDPSYILFLEIFSNLHRENQFVKVSLDDRQKVFIYEYIMNIKTFQDGNIDDLISSIFLHNPSDYLDLLNIKL